MPLAIGRLLVLHAYGPCIHAHGKTVHAYADDHQVYNAFSPVNVNADIESMEKCIT